MAVASYEEEHKHYPPAFLADKDGRPMHSWRVLILPYIGEEKLFKAYNFDEPWDGPNNRKLASRMPRTFALHGEDRPGNVMTNYLAVVGRETIWQGTVGVPRDAIKDGTSNTILLVENAGAGVHWMAPRDLSFAEMDFTINSPNGVSSTFLKPAVVMADCSTMTLDKNVEPQALRAMMTINGGEKVIRDEKHGWQLLPNGRDLP